MRIRRALLFMPGDDRHKIEKGAALRPDAVIMDLEDGVAFSRKQAGRETSAAALYEIDFGSTERLVRINPVTPGGLYSDDILATVAARPDGYVIPKVETAHQIEEAGALLTQLEYEHNLPGGAIRLLAIIETARGVVNLREIIAGADDRLDALIFGAEDLAGDLGAMRTPDGWEVFYARSAVVIHARALGVQAIDTPYTHLENIDGLVAEAEQAHYMGYSGKLAVHPRQVEPIQRVFTPTPDQIEQAQRLLAAHAQAQQAGSGVLVMDGKMVDMPMVKAAEQTLARARAAGIVAD
jgi:citrate lyase beta subunit